LGRERKKKEEKKAQTLRTLTSYLSLQFLTGTVPSTYDWISHQIHFIMPYQPEEEEKKKKEKKKKEIPPRTPHFIISK